MKGISPLVSYVFAILLAIVVIAGVTLLAYSLYNQILQDQIKRDLTQVAAQASSKITEIYSVSKASKSSPQNSSATLLGELQLNLPQQVADRNYKLTLLSASQVMTLLGNVTLDGENVTAQSTAPTGKIIAETTQDPLVEIEYNLPAIDIDIQGSEGNPANATLRYYRYNPNGTIIDTIVLGDFSLIGQVTVVS